MNLNRLFKKPPLSTRTQIKQALLYLAWYENTPVYHYAELAMMDLSVLTEQEAEDTLGKLRFIQGGLQRPLDLSIDQLKRNDNEFE